jgi:hypothetical protein
MFEPDEGLWAKLRGRFTQTYWHNANGGQNEQVEATIRAVWELLEEAQAQRHAQPFRTINPITHIRVMNPDEGAPLIRLELGERQYIEMERLLREGFVARCERHNTLADYLQRVRDKAEFLSNGLHVRDIEYAVKWAADDADQAQRLTEKVASGGLDNG